MFDIIADRFIKLQRKLLGYGRLSQKEISETLKEIRILLLDADVNYKVVGEFLRSLEEKLKSEKIASSLKPGELVIVELYKEMVKLLGEKPTKLNLTESINTISLFGLQGTGKTTTAAKLAYYYKQKKPLLVACDPKRPAASLQLQLLAEKIKVDFIPVKEDIFETTKIALEFAKKNNNQLVIFDTAGRLHIDEELMKELKEFKEKIKPTYNLLVVDGMVGQDAVNQAKEFNEKIGIDGVIITKMDGDAKGGACLSIRAVSKAPIIFIGVGEKIEDLQEFHPDRIATRILGRGDIKTLMEKVERTVDREEQEKLAKKFLKGEFNLEDFLNQIRMIKKMGNLQKILSMLPIPELKGINFDEKEIVKMEAIILSMTKEERRNPKIIDGSRKRRIALGSGTSVTDVNRLLNEFFQAQKLVKIFKDKRKLF
ncbi:MAG: signal recognition particle protein [candidate division WOR-3 bacterium]|nr:signal recognition particle protein [candidate division WOR-3 bacterium]MDW8113509.1 signal recognition particle protein [candidate division WOR-3 bacterium]